jgi:hypothetical protein
MKKNNRIKTIIAAILFLSTQAAGQTLKFSQLMAGVKCTNFNCFNDLAIASGYSYDTVAPAWAGGNVYYFNSNKKREIGSLPIPDVITYELSSANKKTVSVQTFSSDYYAQVLKDIKATGFVEESSQPVDGSVYSNYSLKSNPYLKLQIVVGATERKGVKYTYYTIKLEDLKY